MHQLRRWNENGNSIYVHGYKHRVLYMQGSTGIDGTFLNTYKYVHTYKHTYLNGSRICCNMGTGFLSYTYVCPPFKSLVTHLIIACFNMCVCTTAGKKFKPKTFWGNHRFTDVIIYTYVSALRYTFWPKKILQPSITLLL